MSVYESVQSIFAPEKNWEHSKIEEFKRQRQIQALWIGILAFALPVLLYFGNLTADCFRDSISHSYYIPFWGDVFVALTCFVGLFLLFYRGQSRAERALAAFGGLCAVVVALNPTNGSGCDELFAPSRIFFDSHTDLIVSSAFPVDTIRGYVHLGAAVSLFVCLAIFNIFVFTITDKTNSLQFDADKQRERANRNKRIRNVIYQICGWLMLVTIIILALGLTVGFKQCDAFSAAVGIKSIAVNCKPAAIDSLFWDDNNVTFYLEWLGLALFGIAWFVKGRGGGFLLLDETPNQIISRPWWWKK